MTGYVGAPYVKGSAASKLAAKSVIDSLCYLEALVYNYVASAGEKGATCDEAEEALDLTHQTCSPRFRALRDAGLIVRKGTKRKTRQKRKADVYVVPYEGFVPVPQTDKVSMSCKVSAGVRDEFKARAKDLNTTSTKLLALVVDAIIDGDLETKLSFLKKGS